MNQREHRHQNENGNDEGADGVGDAHVVALGVSGACVSYLDEEGGENDAHRAQRVRQHVQAVSYTHLTLPTTERV